MDTNSHFNTYANCDGDSVSGHLQQFSSDTYVYSQVRVNDNAEHCYTSLELEKAESHIRTSGAQNISKALKPGIKRKTCIIGILVWSLICIAIGSLCSGLTVYYTLESRRNCALSEQSKDSSTTATEKPLISTVTSQNNVSESSTTTKMQTTLPMTSTTPTTTMSVPTYTATTQKWKIITFITIPYMTKSNKGQHIQQ